MESILGRYLTKKEVVDHIDGNKLNNHPDNLRLFESNGSHLSQTLKGKVPKWSKAGRKHFVGRKGLPEDYHKRVHTYKKKKRSGEIRRQQIALAREQLGINHHALSNTEQYLKKK
jgi:hypothetical protein